MGWLPEGFETPQRVDLPTGHHLRPMGAADTEVDYPVVMGHREKLWEKYGEAWGWPPAHMTLEQDREDLQHHQDEIAAHVTFLFGAFNEDESQLFGCVYVDPPDDRSPEGADAVSSWWATNPALEQALDEFVPRWLEQTWRFRSVHFFP